MNDLRTARADAIRRRIGNGLADTPDIIMPLLLDDLEAIDAQHPPEPLTVKRADDTPSDAEIGAWIEAHPGEFAVWVRRRDRIEGGSPGEATGTRTAAAARTGAARRRTPRAGGA